MDQRASTNIYSVRGTAQSRAEQQENARAAIPRAAVRAAIAEAWRTHPADGPGFRAALAEAGLVLARGDKTDFIVIDAGGGQQSLARAIAGLENAEGRRLGAKAANSSIAALMRDIDPASL